MTGKCYARRSGPLYSRFGRGGSKDPGQIQALLEALTELNQLRLLHRAFQVERQDEGLALLEVNLLLYAEAVRGSAYASQIRRRIECIQGPFEAWFRGKAGIGPLRALQILDAFEEIFSANVQSQKLRLDDLTARMQQVVRLGNEVQDRVVSGEQEQQRKALAEEMMLFMDKLLRAFAVSLDQVASRVPGFTRKGWESFRELIGLTPASRQAIGNAREIGSRPVYFLSGDRFIVIDICSAYDALFEALDELTRTDQNFRDRRYTPNLSEWMENEVPEYLRRLFSSSAVYGPLTYPDPDNPGGETELDAAVFWAPFLVLIEVKGRQFRPRSRIGDLSRLRDDLENNIQSAFEQATRATRFIHSNATATFIEKSTGRKLEVRRDRLQRIFPISVTLHRFGMLATQLALLKKIGLFKESAYPWSVSLADLDVVSRFASSPDVFLHYVQRRLDLQRSEKNIMGG